MSTISTRLVSPLAETPAGCDSSAMLTEIYIETLLVDEEQADQVWEAWYSGEIDEARTFLMWWLIADGNTRSISSSILW